MSLTYLTIDEVVGMLRLSKDTVYRLAKSGELPGKKVGRAWRFAEQEIESFVAHDFSDGEHAKQARAENVAREQELEAAIRDRDDQLSKLNRQLESEICGHNQTEAYMRAIFESVGDGLIVVNERYQIVLFNRAAEEICGIGKVDVEPEGWPEAYGIYLSDGITPCPAISLPFVQAVQGERVDHAELVIRNEFLPAPVCVACRATPVFDDNGLLKGGVMVFHDITARKQAEEEFRQNERRLRNLLDYLPQMAHAPTTGPSEQLPTMGVSVAISSTSNEPPILSATF